MLIMMMALGAFIVGGCVMAGSSASKKTTSHK
jgi:outer membrane murein-binding lipoprotein Lpp